MTDETTRRPGILPFVPVLAGGLILWTLMMTRFGVGWRDTALFLLALAAGVYLPGRWLVRALRLPLDRLEEATLALVAGMTATTTIYRLAASTGRPVLLWFWLGAAVVAAVVAAVRKRPRPPARRFRLTRTGPAFAAIAVLVLALLAVDNYRNGLTAPSGAVRFHMHYYDGFTRAALARELTHTVPPQMPFASGMPISYHYDMNLFISFFYKHLGLGMFDLVHRLTITFYFALVLMSAFVFLRRWGRSDRAALLGTFLLVFGSGGLGWLAGWVGGFNSFWGKIFFSFYLIDITSINPFLPAFAVLFAGLFLLGEYFETSRAGALIGAAYFLAAISGYKMTFTVPVLAGLGGAALIAYLKRRDFRPALAAASAGVMTLPFLLAAYAHNVGGPPFGLKIHFLRDWIGFAMLDAKAFGLATAWGKVVRGEAAGPLQIGLAAAAGLVFIVGAFGLSLLALPAAVKEGFRADRKSLTTLVVLALAAASIGLFFVADPVLGSQGRPWLVVDLLKLAGAAGLLLLAKTASDWLAGKKRAVRAAAVAAILLAGFPNAVQFMYLKVTRPESRIFDGFFNDACRFLTQKTDPETVVLQAADLMYVCYFADRRVVLDASPHSYLEYHLLPSQQEERRADISRFLMDPESNAGVLAKYGVGIVWIRRGGEDGFWKNRLPEEVVCREGAGAPAFRLRIVHRNARHALYAVHPDSLPLP
jgi:hypothetical protein